MSTLYLLIILLFPITALAQAGEPNQAPPISASFTFKDLGENDILVKTIFDQIQVKFPLAEGQEIRQAVLKLRLSHSKKLLPNLSNLTIALNNEPVANLSLTPDNAKPAFIDLSLPIAALRPGQNILKFRFNLRLRDKGCSDLNSPGLWAKIEADSIIQLNNVDVPIAPDLARFPAPFTTLTTLGGPRLTMVLPATPTPAELTVAARLAASLGQAAGWENPPLQALTFDQLDNNQAAADHLIVIDTAGRNPLAAEVAPGLSEHISPYNPNRLMLIVSGSDEPVLFQAADMVTTQSAYTRLQGDHVKPEPVTPQLRPEKPAQATLAELGFSDKRVRGIGRHDLYYPIDIPYDWKITSEASIELRFAHSPHLTSADSLMMAFVNGAKVVDVPLTDRNADDGRLIVQLSPRRIYPGRNWLHLVFDLHIPRQNCNFRYLEEAWAVASATTSVMNLAHVKSEPPLDLRYWPLPLILPADLSADVFVLPAQPLPADLTAMIRMAAKLGPYSLADSLRLRAIMADQFDPASVGSDHLIAIGQPASNSLVATYDTALPQPLSRVNGSIQPVEGRDLLPGEADGQAGYLQVLPAPWPGVARADGILTVVSGFEAKQLAAIVEAMPTQQRRWQIQGNVAVITSDGIKGLTIGQLAGAPLPAPARLSLSLLLITATIVTGGVGYLSARWRRKQAEKVVEDEYIED